MRIISKLKDYYDSVQAYGQDERCVYMRKSEEHTITDESIIGTLGDYFQMMRGSVSGLVNCKRYIIGFCGKLYPVGVMDFETDMRGYVGKTWEFSIEGAAYDADAIEHFLNSYKKLKGEASKFNTKPHYSSKGLKRSSVDAAVKEIHSSNKLEELFVQHKTPCFVIGAFYKNLWDNFGHKRMLTINPDLSKYKFYKIKDTVTAYQDINQYISGILGLNDKEIVHISDEHMKSQKGFYKYSFKTLPTKKR